MKSLDTFITESQDLSSLGKKILKELKNDGDIVDAILKRTENWDANKFSWSREPMFLVASSGIELDIQNKEKVRNLTWVRQKFFNVLLDSETGVQGTIANYNFANDEGVLPLSVIGIFFDRQFYPITSIDTYKNIKAQIENE